MRGLKPGLSTSDVQVRTVSCVASRAYALASSQAQLALHTNSLSTQHPDYSVLAARVFLCKIYKATVKCFSVWVASYGTGRVFLSLVESMLTRA